MRAVQGLNPGPPDTGDLSSYMQTAQQLLNEKKSVATLTGATDSAVCYSNVVVQQSDARKQAWTAEQERIKRKEQIMAALNYVAEQRWHLSFGFSTTQDTQSGAKKVVMGYAVISTNSDCTHGEYWIGVLDPTVISTYWPYNDTTVPKGDPCCQGDSVVIEYVGTDKWHISGSQADDYFNYDWWPGK